MNLDEFKAYIESQRKASTLEAIAKIKGDKNVSN